MRIKKSSLCFIGFLVFASLSFCLNFFFLSKPDTIIFDSTSETEETSNYNESLIEAQIVKELSQLPPKELKQFMMNQP